MQTDYLGKNVATIHGLPMGGGGYKIADNLLEGFEKAINNQPHKYLTVITANYYQKDQL